MLTRLFPAAAVLATAGALTAQPAADDSVITFGIIGTDTSHAVQFAKLLNNADDKFHVPGGRVTHAFKGGSADIASSANRVDKFAAEMETSYSVKFVSTVEELVNSVDVVLLESVDGRTHLEQVKPVFAAKKPVYIDKPFAGSLADAKEIVRLAKESGTPCWSSSSLRFFPGVTGLIGSPKVGDITGAVAYSPATLEATHPDLYWYGIHGVETLYTLMGPGCQSVTRTSTPDADVVVGTWADGRVGTFYGMRSGKTDYGALVFGTKGIQQTEPISGNLYAPLVQEIMKFAKTKQPPVPLETTLEIMTFMEAADISKKNDGKPANLKEVLEQAGK